MVITEGIPVHDTTAFWAHNVASGQPHPDHRAELPGHRLAGRSPTPASSRPTSPARAGSAWSASRGTLTYQMMYELRDIGFSTCVGIGGDPVIGTTHIDALAAFQEDPDTDAIVMIGEIGGDAEERAAEFIRDHVTKPVVGYIAGFTAPPGKTMGHAGAIISGSSGTAAGQAGRAGGGRGEGRPDPDRDRPPHAADHAGKLTVDIDGGPVVVPGAARTAPAPVRSTAAVAE